MVAHLAVIAATRVRIPASCQILFFLQILYIKLKLGTESGPSLTLGTKNKKKKKIIIIIIILSTQNLDTGNKLFDKVACPAPG